MTESLTDQAAELLREALSEPNGPKRALMMDEALRLNRLAAALQDTRAYDGAPVADTDDEGLGPQS